MNLELAGKRVAILVADGFEQCELTEPKSALEQAGAATSLIALKPGKVRGWQQDHYGDSFDVDATVDDASVDEFDALLLPGVLLNPDALRESATAVRFVRRFLQQGKPVAAVCHGVQTMINAGAVRGRTLTSYPSVKSDLTSAGANWVDAAVVVDHGLVTGRDASDFAAFKAKMIQEFAQHVTPPIRQ